MNIIKFSFNDTKARELRAAINDREKFSIEREASGSKEKKEPSKSYSAWNRLCATMTRLEDTIHHINNMELGKFDEGQAAFDFYEFINCSYKNAIIYSLRFLQNSLQLMIFEGFENTGIKYKSGFIDSDLYSALSSPLLFGGEFEKYSYEIGKLYTLTSNSQSNIYDKMFSRGLLEKCKDLINKYICFTNEESDEEVYVLIKLALYLESLTRKCIINKNIPNEEQYRETLLTEAEVEDLHQEEPEEEIQPIDLSIFDDIIKEYGG